MDCSYLSAFGHGQISERNTDLINIPFNNLETISKLDFQEISAFGFELGNSSSLIKYPNADFINAVTSEIKKHSGIFS